MRVCCLAISRRAFSRLPPEARDFVLFSWGFPPNYSTGAVIPAEIALAAAQRGWQVTVVAAPVVQAADLPAMPMPPFPVSVKILRPDIDVTESERPVRRPFYRLIRSVHGGLDVAIIMAELALRSMRFRKPAVVFTSGPDFSGFVAGVVMRIAFGSDTKLVFQYRDEWTVEPPPFVQVWPFSRRWEALCLRFCDMVTFVTPGKLGAYIREFPFLSSKKLCVHRNGVPGLRQGAGVPAPGDSKRKHRYKILFVGRFSEPLHLYPLLADLKHAMRIDREVMENYTFEIIGAQDEGFKRDLMAFGSEFPGSIELTGHVDASNVPAVMASNDALLLVCNARYDGWVPLKLFDYMSTTRPILAYGTTSEAASIVESTGAGIVVPSDEPRELIAALTKLRASDPTIWDSPRRREWVMENDRSRILEDLFNEVNEITRSVRS